MGIDFELTPEQRSLRDWVRGFVEKSIKPRVFEIEENPEASDEILREASKIGLLALPIPQEYGGGGVSSIETNIALEEIAVGDGGIATAIGASWFGVTPILIAGNREQMDRFLPPLASKDEVNLCCMAMTEEQGGSDIEDHRMGGRTIRTKVREEGEYYVITGRKMWPSNFDIATFYTTVATFDPTGEEGTCVIVVERWREGLSFGQPEYKMGMHGDRNGEIIYDDVKVPKENLLGGKGLGLKILTRTITYNRGGAGAISVGMARGAMERVLEYSKQRIVGGKPLIKHELVQAIFADMAIELDAARLLVWRAAWFNSQPGRRSLRWATMAKVYASDVAERITSRCVQLMGSYGYSRKSGVEKYMRDNKIIQIYLGANELCRQIIGELLEETGPFEPIHPIDRVKVR